MKAAMLSDLMKSRRRLLIPEVVQTSDMDCGPAALACLLNGYGINASYGRLREECQTNIDGTSIDTIEGLAIQLGLNAEQVMLPIEHVLFPEAQALPAIAVVRNSQGCAHFVVLWSHRGGLVQVMDPAVGRRWLTPRYLQKWLYLHPLRVEQMQWREWAASQEFVGCLRRSLVDLRVTADLAQRLIDTALADETWRSLAGLQACVRMMSVVSSRALRSNRKPELVRSLFEQVLHADLSWDASLAKGSWPTIPVQYWSVLPAPPAADGTTQLVVRGAVLVRVRDRRHETIPQRNDVPDVPGEASTAGLSSDSADTVPRPVAAMTEPPSRPLRDLFHLLRVDGLLDAAVLAKALLLGSSAVLVQAVLFRSFLDIGRDLEAREQRLAAMGLLLVFLLAMLILNVPVTAGVLRIGRRLEARLRIAILRKLANLDDRYLHSRLVSDMAERSHSVSLLRQLPNLGVQLLGSAFQLIMTVAGIIWLAPKAGLLAILTAAVTIALPLLCQPILAERGLRVRNHVGALSRFYLDAMLGLLPIRAHTAERAVRYAHERLLLEWGRAGLQLQRLAVSLNAVQFITGFGLAIWLISSHVIVPNEAGSLLLLTFWALSIPTLGTAIASSICSYADYRNVMLRLFEPLGAPEAHSIQQPSAHSKQQALVTTSTELPKRTTGVRVDMVNVDLAVAGHSILAGVTLAVEPGSHVAIVGPSGAGKSSLVGLLLGWFQVSRGKILIDGRPMDSELLKHLRAETAWVDPAVQLWNRSLEDNLRYGTNMTSVVGFGKVIELAELRELLESLPDGLQTSLGESGALVSGGEGQRVRLARAMLRRDARLVVLDEPFAALDRARREKLIVKMRELWRGATLFYITHNTGEALAFDRVLIIESGQIVEDGNPRDLLTNEDSHYRAMYESDSAVRNRFLSTEFWRRLELRGGRLIEKNKKKPVGYKPRPWLRDRERRLKTGTGTNA